MFLSILFILLRTIYTADSGKPICCDVQEYVFDQSVDSSEEDFVIYTKSNIDKFNAYQKQSKNDCKMTSNSIEQGDGTNQLNSLEQEDFVPGGYLSKGGLEQMKDTSNSTHSGLSLYDHCGLTIAFGGLSIENTEKVHEPPKKTTKHPDDPSLPNQKPEENFIHPHGPSMKNFILKHDLKECKEDACSNFETVDMYLPIDVHSLSYSIPQPENEMHAVNIKNDKDKKIHRKSDLHDDIMEKKKIEKLKSKKIRNRFQHWPEFNLRLRTHFMHRRGYYRPNDRTRRLHNEMKLQNTDE